MSSGAPPTLAAAWSAAARRGPDRPFLTYEGADAAVTDWSYGDFDELVSVVAGRFAAAGVNRRRGVHLALRNSPAFVAAWLAASRLGSHIVPADPASTGRELGEHLVRTRPAVAIGAAERADAHRVGLATAASAGVDDITVIAVDEDDVTLGPLRGDRPAPAVDADPATTAAVLFSSGTTGRPKGVVITQANFAFTGTVMARAASLGPDDRQIVVLPLFHANAQYYSFAPAIVTGASVALVHTFSASGFIDQAARHRATHASLFAGPMRMILARGGPQRPGDEPLSLRHCWFAQNLTADQYETLASWLGCRPRQLYGMTETLAAVLTDEADDPRPDTMGRPTEGCVVEVHDGEGRPVPPGTEGEIVVGGVRGETLFAEYLDDPATTAASFRGHWFRTGDRARVGDDGRFRFAGRRAEVLKVAGENVSTVEIEAVLGEHPEVFEAAVIGAPDPVRDEVPVAFVVRARKATGDDDTFVAALQRWAAEHLTKAKRPHRYVVVDELPRTSVGKIRKFLLADASTGTPQFESSPPSNPTDSPTGAEPAQETR